MSGNGQSSGPAPGAGPEAAAALEEGLEHYRARDLAGAHAAFARAHRRAPSDPRSLSWYGLTLVLVERNSNLGSLYTDRALQIGGLEPELALNQARVALALGQRDRALRALERGLAVAPADTGLASARASLGRRRRPIIRFLPRASPVNRWLGNLRHRFWRRAPAAPDPEPARLGELPPPAPPKD